MSLGLKDFIAGKRIDLKMLGICCPTSKELKGAFVPHVNERYFKENELFN